MSQLTRLTLSLPLILTTAFIAGCEGTNDDGLSEPQSLQEILDRGNGNGRGNNGNSNNVTDMEYSIDDHCTATITSNKDISNYITECPNLPPEKIEATDANPIGKELTLHDFTDGCAVTVKSGNNGRRGRGEQFSSDCIPLTARFASCGDDFTTPSDPTTLVVLFDTIFDCIVQDAQGFELWDLIPPPGRAIYANFNTNTSRDFNPTDLKQCATDLGCPVFAAEIP